MVETSRKNRNRKASGTSAEIVSVSGWDAVFRLPLTFLRSSHPLRIEFKDRATVTGDIGTSSSGCLRRRRPVHVLGAQTSQLSVVGRRSEEKGGPGRRGVFSWSSFADETDQGPRGTSGYVGPVSLESPFSPLFRGNRDEFELAENATAISELGKVISVGWRSFSVLEVPSAATCWRDIDLDHVGASYGSRQSTAPLLVFARIILFQKHLRSCCVNLTTVQFIPNFKTQSGKFPYDNNIKERKSLLESPVGHS